MNFLLHLSLASLFFFKPGRSWNRCRERSLITLFLAQLIFSNANPRPISTLPVPISTVRPVLGPSFIGVLGAGAWTFDASIMTFRFTSRSRCPGLPGFIIRLVLKPLLEAKGDEGARRGWPALPRAPRRSLAESPPLNFFSRSMSELGKILGALVLLAQPRD